MEASLRVKAEQLAEEFADRHTTPEDLNAFIRLMMKAAVERMLNTELDVHLGRRGVPAAAATALVESPPPSESPGAPGAETPPPARSNHRNGRSKKTVSGDLGELEIETPRDRNGTFEPALIPKHQRRIAGFDEKILRVGPGCSPTRCAAKRFFFRRRFLRRDQRGKEMPVDGNLLLTPRLEYQPGLPLTAG